MLACIQLYRSCPEYVSGILKFEFKVVPSACLNGAVAIVVRQRHFAAIECIVTDDRIELWDAGDSDI